MSNARDNGRRRPNRKRNQDKIKFNKDKPISEKSKDCANDPNWYVREGQLVKDVASISFNNALGANIKVDPDYESSVNGITAFDFNAPGIMAIHTATSPGYSSSNVSPINIAAKNIYSFVRHANGGHANYESPDLIMYFWAMDSIFNVIYDLQRALGVCQVFSQRNRYIGDALLSAMGYVPADFRMNIAQYRARLNMLIVKASVFAIPKMFTLFNRHAWMYSNVFMDNPVDKAQMYLYVPNVVYKFDESTTPGQLTPTLVHMISDLVTKRLKPNMVTASAVFNIADTLMSALQNSEDINIMSGDILKAYGRENLYNFAMVPETYAIAPIYSEEILDQIHNTRFAGNLPVAGWSSVEEGSTYSLQSMTITQSTDLFNNRGLIFEPYFNGAQYLGYEQIIDMSDNDPTPERVLVATRNTISGVVHRMDDNATFVTKLTSFASDIPLFATIFRILPTGVLREYAAYDGTLAGMESSTITFMSMFNKAPILLRGSVDGGTYTSTIPFGDIENFTVVSKDTIDNMHVNAMLSMLGVPA